jgi:transcriptional regulator with XRE-family HTH domain
LRQLGWLAMVSRMTSRSVPGVVNQLPGLLRERGITWTELGRRTLLSSGHLARLRAPGANPRLAVAERIAAALDLPVESVWRLERSPCRL